MFEMWGDDCAELFGQGKRHTSTEELSVELARGVAYSSRHSLHVKECDKSSDSEPGGSDFDGFTLAHRPKRNSVMLECVQDESHKKNKICLAPPDELSEPARESEKPAFSEERSGEGAERNCASASTERLKWADPGPAGKSWRPSEQQGDIADASGPPCEHVVTHKRVEETAFAFGTANLVDALTSESDGDFEQVSAVASLEMQDNSDSEWSVV